jgi:uncharacterized protein
MTKMLRIRLKFLLVSVLIAILLILVISYVHAYRFTHFSDSSNKKTDPKSLTALEKFVLVFTGIENPRPQDLDLPKTSYTTFIIEGDKRLESWFMPISNSKGIVLLYHGYTGSKSQMVTRAADLNAMGYSTAIIGFRGGGNSEGDYTTVGYEENKDVISSYEFYKEKFPDQPIVLFGTSMGAAAILKAFTETDLQVTGIILEYPFATLHQSVKNRFKVMGFPSFPMSYLLTYFGGWQLGYDGFDHKPSEYAKKVNCPVLYLYGNRDDRVTSEETSEVFQNITDENKTLHIFKGGGHEALNETFSDEWFTVCGKFLSELKK